MYEAVKILEKQQILSSIKLGLNDINNGNTRPINELWEALEN
jgi:hypothetical protein